MVYHNIELVQQFIYCMTSKIETKVIMIFHYNFLFNSKINYISGGLHKEKFWFVVCRFWTLRNGISSWIDNVVLCVWSKIWYGMLKLLKVLSSAVICCFFLCFQLPFFSEYHLAARRDIYIWYHVSAGHLLLASRYHPG